MHSFYCRSGRQYTAVLHCLPHPIRTEKDEAPKIERLNFKPLVRYTIQPAVIVVPPHLPYLAVKLCYRRTQDLRYFCSPVDSIHSSTIQQPNYVYTIII